MGEFFMFLELQNDDLNFRLPHFTELPPQIIPVSFLIWATLFSHQLEIYLVSV